jgi:hypothetical protein
MAGCAWAAADCVRLPSPPNSIRLASGLPSIATVQHVLCAAAVVDFWFEFMGTG